MEEDSPTASEGGRDDGISVSEVRGVFSVALTSKNLNIHFKIFDHFIPIYLLIRLSVDKLVSFLKPPPFLPFETGSCGSG